ncbi:MarR family transcriptional regulator [Streptomyces sp. NBC_01244]|uniref:MarR family transcriptional regulator n=1 Tax=Streptomyces sp. NBC_01244 TaxID=2903797 RepID=UPI002E165A6A|nr:MarR family transcriptional regulator [Streptomyces sp. NBC_01244]
MPRKPRSTRRELVNEETGVIYELRETQEPDPRRSYNFGGRHGQISFPRVMAMLAKESGLTGDDIRVFFYCGIKTFEKGGATAGETADYLGLTPQATRRIAKKLSDNKLFLVAEVVGRTIKYKASPHIITSCSGEEQSEEASHYHLPTLPGRPEAGVPKDKADVTPKRVPRARRTSVADKGTAAPEAERADDVRDLGRAGEPGGGDSRRAG